MSFHAANADKSTRLQRVLAVLKDGGRIGVTSRDLMTKANVVAPGTCVSELRRNGYVILCELLTTYGDGTKVYLYRYVGRQER